MTGGEKDRFRVNTSGKKEQEWKLPLIEKSSNERISQEQITEAVYCHSTGVKISLSQSRQERKDQKTM